MTSTARCAPTIDVHTHLLLPAVEDLLMPHGVIDGFPTVDLFQDRWLHNGGRRVPEGEPDAGSLLVQGAALKTARRSRRRAG